MRIYGKIIVLVVLAGILGIFSEAIVRVKFLQLRVQISRKQLLNYELSSDILRTRFRRLLLSAGRPGSDFGEEVRINILESSVMNEIPAGGARKQIGPLEHVGILAANFVRLLNLKPLLRVSEDEDILLRLQYAFFLERKRKYAEASVRYAELEKRLSGSLSDDYAFVLLHQGYIQAVTGDADQARKRLLVVSELFSGTHFSDSARALIAVLDETEKRERDIVQAHEDDLKRARALYGAGRFAQAVELFGREQAELNEADQFSYARALEEMGRTREATAIFKRLAESAGSRDLRVRSARRLWLMGRFFGGGKKVTDFAEKKARDLGDQDLLKKYTPMAKLSKEAAFVRELTKPENKDNDAHRSLREDISASLETALPEDASTQNYRLAVQAMESGSGSTKSDVARVDPRVDPRVDTSKKPEEETRAPESRTTRPTPGNDPSLVNPKVIPEGRDRPEKKTADKTPAAEPATTGRVRIYFQGGRALDATHIRTQGGMLSIGVKGSEIELPLSLVFEINVLEGARPLVIELSNGTRGRVRAFKRVGDSLTMTRVDGAALTTNVGIRSISY